MKTVLEYFRRRDEVALVKEYIRRLDATKRMASTWELWNR